MPGDIRRPEHDRERIEDERPEPGERRELPRPDDDDQIGRKHFPSPGRDTAVPPLPEGHTDAPPP
jgi:hypothetical protein